jgi:two-component system response regulator FlrC
MLEADAEAPSSRLSKLVAEDPKSREALTLARRVAAADVTVMLTGESGVGKELFARFIHDHSARRSGPFVAINCAAIPESMLEAMLFGHEKGAFTGAADARSGKFEQADGGTLLLDEVTEMALGLQAKLLRVLQEREVERLGAVRGRRVDVRVIATSNRDLRRAVQDGILREDIYYRLNVFPLRIPPLRERRGDIVPLAEHLLARHCGGDTAPALSPAAARFLEDQEWPGNVRELENAVQRALILRHGVEIGVDDLRIELSGFGDEAGLTTRAVAGGVTGADPRGAAGADVRGPAGADALGTNGADAGGMTAGAGNLRARGDLESSLRVSEGELILKALRAEDGRRNAAAQRLGISPRTLRYKLARLREAGLALP